MILMAKSTVDDWVDNNMIYDGYIINNLLSMFFWKNVGKTMP